MTIISQILIGLVAVLHIYFLYLEMFAWTKPLGRKVFQISKDEALKTRSLAANQGLYNGFLASGLLWSLCYPNVIVATELQYFFLGCVVVAGLYGGYSVNKRIVVVQSLPAALGLSVLFLR